MVLVVVDIGCVTHNAEESIHKLVEEYHPDRLIGFDPHPSLLEESYFWDGTEIFLNRAAAWLYDGEIAYTPDAAGSRIRQGFTQVECFDLCRWLWLEVTDADVIIKFDCEGAEYALLNAMIEEGLDRKVDEILVEWHNAENPREPLRDVDKTYRDMLLSHLKPKKCVRAW